MAATRIIPLHTGKGRTIGQAISDMIDYVENPNKTDNGRKMIDRNVYDCIGYVRKLAALKHPVGAYFEEKALTVRLIFSYICMDAPVSRLQRC